MKLTLVVLIFLLSSVIPILCLPKICHYLSAYNYIYRIRRQILAIILEYIKKGVGMIF